MEWWIAAAGLALLFLLFLAARKKPILSRRDVSPEASLSARMKALAGQTPRRRRTRLLPPASALKGLEKKRSISERPAGRKKDCLPPASFVIMAVSCRRKRLLCARRRVPSG